jgi:hypothetical protein
MVVGPAPESSCAGGVVFLPTSRVPGPFIRDSSGVHRVDVGSAQGPASSSHFPMGLSETPDPCNAPLTGEARRGVGSNTRVCVSMYDPRRALRSYPRSRVLRLVASARWPFLHCPVAIIHRGFIVRCYCRRCPAATPQACTTQTCTRSLGSSWTILTPLTGKISPGPEDGWTGPPKEVVGGRLTAEAKLEPPSFARSGRPRLVTSSCASCTSFASAGRPARSARFALARQASPPSPSQTSPTVTLGVN